MDSGVGWVVPLEEAAECQEHSIGGKAANLAHLAQTGVRVPEGFCITSVAYERFVQAVGLPRIIQAELGRKPLDEMRWEEIWDAALRLRAIFINTPIPALVVREIQDALRVLGPARPVAVRSSAPGEDSAQRSFAERVAGPDRMRMVPHLRYGAGSGALSSGRGQGAGCE